MSAPKQWPDQAEIPDEVTILRGLLSESRAQTDLAEETYRINVEVLLAEVEGLKELLREIVEEGSTWTGDDVIAFRDRAAAKLHGRDHPTERRGDMFSASEIEKKVNEHIAKAEAEDASVLILAQAEIRDGQAGASIYAYQRIGDHFGAGEFVHWSPGAPVDAGVEFRVKW